MNYTVDPDIPFRLFTKGKHWGVINTETKKIIIPAKYQYIDQIITTENYPWKADELFYLVENEVEYNLRNTNGEIIFEFKNDEYLDSFFEYNNKYYVITNRITEIKDEWSESEFHSKNNKKLYLIKGKSGVELIASTEIQRLGKGNLIYFNDYYYNYYDDVDSVYEFFDLNTSKKMTFKDGKYMGFAYIESRNEIWTQKFDNTERRREPYYDVVIDSSLNIRQNLFKKAFKLYRDYFLTETENGIQLMSYDGTAAPFVYPYIETVRYRNTDIDDFHLNKILDKLFIFSNEKEPKKIGVIEFDGKIILPAEYKKIRILKIYYTEIPSEEFSNFIKESKLNPFYYFTVKEENQKYEYSIFDFVGEEIITVKDIQQDNGFFKFDFPSDPPEIQFLTRDSVRIYDLNSRQLKRIETRNVN